MHLVRLLAAVPNLRTNACPPLIRFTYTERTCCGSNYTNTYMEPTCSITAEGADDEEDGDAVGDEQKTMRLVQFVTSADENTSSS